MKVYELLESDKYYYISTEVCEGGELFQLLQKKKKFNEKDAANTMEQVLGAINHMHVLDPPMAHRDLKEENILLDSKDLENM